MRRRTVLLPALLALAAVYCASPAAPKGPVLFGIISGNHQKVLAGSDSLIQPVVGQAYRQKNGSVAFRMIGAQPLEAQTSIGTGVANILTCSSPVGNAGLVAYVQCANTDANGMVTYWYAAGTIATDSACAEIRATPNGEPAVLATTCSVVEPGPMAGFFVDRPDSIGSQVSPGDTVDIRSLLSRAVDQYGNSVPLDSLRGLAGSDVGWAWYEAVNSYVDPSQPSASGWLAVVPNPDSLGWPKVAERFEPDSTHTTEYWGYHYIPRLAVWVSGARNTSGTWAQFTTPEVWCGTGSAEPAACQ